MKLIKLIFNIVEVLLNAIYGILISPWVFSKFYINRRWRKIAKIGDKCYFDNITGTQTWGEIYKIEGENCGIKGNSFSRWIRLNELKIK